MQVTNLTDICEQAFPLLYGGPCIYALLRDNKVVYVGQSQEIWSRLGTHRKEQYKDFDKVFVFPCQLTELGELEAEFIIAHKPEYNLRLPPNSKWKTAWEVKKLVSRDYSKYDTLHKVKTVLRIYEVTKERLHHAEYYNMHQVWDILEHERREGMHEE